MMRQSNQFQPTRYYREEASSAAPEPAQVDGREASCTDQFLLPHIDNRTCTISDFVAGAQDRTQDSGSTEEIKSRERSRPKTN
jgi:hypothetical protein